MENKKSIILFFIGLGVGIVLSNAFLVKNKNHASITTESQAQEKLAECEAQKDQVSEKLKELGESSSGKTSDEILAEMMKIFVADWGLKLKFKSAEAKCDLPKPAQLPVVESSPVNPNNMSTPPEGHDIKPENKGPLKGKEIQKRFELTVISSQSEEAALRALEKTKVADIYTIYSETTDVSAKDLQALVGKFTGGFKPVNPKEKSLDIELELELKKRGTPPEGTYSITEYSDGKQTSRGSGRGSFKAFSVLKGNQAVFVERSGGDNVMQLYYVPSIDALVGNDYIKSNKSKLEYNGQVLLRKNNY